MPLIRPTTALLATRRCALALPKNSPYTTTTAQPTHSTTTTISRHQNNNTNGTITINAPRAAAFSSSTKSLAAAGADAGHKEIAEMTEEEARAAAHGEAHGADHHHHEDHFDPPSGWLWGIKPGEKVEKEGWENIWIYGFFGGLGAAVVAYAFKPDTSIQTWALEEARRRLEAEGILKEPESK